MPNWARNLSLVITLLAAPVAATPPQIIWVQDTLFAQTNDTVLVLRTISDNHGSHFTTQTDTFLLTLSLNDGAVLSVALVERAVEVALGEEDVDNTIFHKIENAVNPYAVRSGLNAAPLIDPEHLGYSKSMLHPMGLLVLDGEELTHRLILPDVRTQILTSLARTRAVLPVLFGPEEFDLFAPQNIVLQRDCTSDLLRTRWQLDTVPAALVRLSCEDWDDGASLTLWVVVPALQ